jgi:hypothetical protein
MLKNYSLIIFLKELKTTTIKCYITNKREREREKKFKEKRGEKTHGSIIKLFYYFLLLFILFFYCVEK